MSDQRTSEHAEEIDNLIAFHLVDFVGWNNGDMEVMRTYHAPVVLVDMAGERTDGIDPHVAAIESMLSDGATKIVQHSPMVAEGPWTAVVGVKSDGRIATVSQWQAGAMISETLFLREMTSDEIAGVDKSDPSHVITTPDDARLRALTGAELGWSAMTVNDVVIFTQTVDGKVQQTIGFAKV